MKQGAGDFHRVVRRTEYGFAGEVTTERISAFTEHKRCDGIDRCRKSCGIDASECRKCGGIIRTQDRPRLDGIAVVIKLKHQAMQSFVVDVPGDMSGLRNDLDRLLRVAFGLVREPLAANIDLETTFHDERPKNRNAAPRSQATVSLVAVDVLDSSAKREPPANRISLVTGMTEERRIGNLGNVLPHHLGVTAEAAAGEHQRIAGEILASLIGTPHANATHPTVRRIGEYAFDQGLSDDVNAATLRRRCKRRHQFRSRSVRRAMHTLHAVARIQKAVDERKRHRVIVDQPLDRSS